MFVLMNSQHVTFEMRPAPTRCKRSKRDFGETFWCQRSIITFP